MVFKYLTVNQKLHKLVQMRSEPYSDAASAPCGPWRRETRSPPRLGTLLLLNWDCSTRSLNT